MGREARAGAGVAAASLGIGLKVSSGSPEPTLLGLGAICGALVWVALAYLIHVRGRDRAWERAALCVAPLGLLSAHALIRLEWVSGSIPFLPECIGLGASAGLAAYHVLLPGLPWPQPRITASRAAWALALAWAVPTLALSVGAWLQLRHKTQDLAIYEQAIYNTLHGRFLEYTLDFRYPGETLCRFADHFEPIILLAVPFYALAGTPLWFLVAQVLVPASAAVPLTRLGAEWCGSRLAGLGCAFAFLTCRGLGAAIDAEFHPGVLAAPLLLWGIYFGLQKRYWPAGIVLGLALACKESIPATALMVGLYLAWKGRRRFGLALCVGAVVWATVAVGVVIPHYSPTGASFYGSWLNDPTRAEALARGGRPLAAYVGIQATYLVRLVGPSAGLCFLAPGTLALSLPEVLIHLLSGNPRMASFAGHYHVTIMLGVALATVAGLARLRHWALARWGQARCAQRLRVHRAVMLGFCVATVLYARNSMAIPAPGAWPSPALGTAETRAALELLDRVPDGAPVLTNSAGVASHLARRERILLAEGVPEEPPVWAQYAAVEAYHGARQQWDDALGDEFEAIGKAGRFTLWRKRGDAG